MFWAALQNGTDLPPIFFHIDFQNSSIDMILFLNERYGLCGYGKNIEKVSERSKNNLLELLILFPLKSQVLVSNSFSREMYVTSNTVHAKLEA